MYGEPSKIREVADRLDHRADLLRDRARELHTRSETVAWKSAAADRMKQQACDRRDELMAVAKDYDEAAEKVRKHADEVQRLLDLIASIERQARRILSAALDRAKAAIDSVVGGIKDALTPGDEADKKLADTATPPPGHQAVLEMPAVIPWMRT